MRIVLFCSLILAATYLARSETSVTQVHENSSLMYLGFDANDYPGDAALPELRKSFTFSGYWLNVPPGAKTNPWTAKREALIKNGFGFLVLFNGRSSNELKPPADPSDLGIRDAELAVAAAQRDGFPATGSVLIYLDIEEGGRMLPSQIHYIESWTAGVNSKGFLAGVYCSGIKVKEGKGQTITTADDIHQRLPSIRAFFVYNDECPPSPGCVIWQNPPPPSESGFSAARVWQFAQSPRRRNLTSRCSASYSPDGNCYPPAGAGTDHIPLDLDVSVSRDPSTLVFGAIH
ncbi:MAG TPA: glycoside hydrolase domain-containing protein [Candidatus Binatus sp.]|nr:glycoside hydrolase domain-containing protein [Candidatus Binatus sp.]